MSDTLQALAEAVNAAARRNSIVATDPHATQEAKREAYRDLAASEKRLIEYVKWSPVIRDACEEREKQPSSLLTQGNPR